LHKPCYLSRREYLQTICRPNFQVSATLLNKAQCSSICEIAEKTVTLSIVKMFNKQLCESIFESFEKPQC